MTDLVEEVARALAKGSTLMRYGPEAARRHCGFSALKLQSLS